MSKKKTGLDIARSATLEQAMQVDSWARNELPENDDLKALDAQIAADPENAELHKDRGLLLAKLGYYREAAECYSRAIAINPFGWEYYRHRAHRFISCGHFADGAADFTIASRLNPTDWNVWYHLGLSRFLLGQYDKADEAYCECERLSKSGDDIAAVADWHFMTLKRLHRDEDAAKLLAKIDPDMTIDDSVSGSYFNRLLMYKGLKTPESLINLEAGDLEVITQGFGVANWYRMNGEEEKGVALLHRVIDTAENSPWYSAFGCLAAHVDLKNLEEAGKERA